MADERKMINFTPEMGRRLKRTYEEAKRVKKGNETFVFDGNEYVLDYAKYLIEYLEMQWGTL